MIGQENDCISFLKLPKNFHAFFSLFPAFNQPDLLASLFGTDWLSSLGLGNQRAQLLITSSYCLPICLANILPQLSSAKFSSKWKLYMKNFPGVIPFMVSIFDSANNQSICGGSVLTKKYVLTAFHCVQFKARWPRRSVNINFSLWKFLKVHCFRKNNLFTQDYEEQS